MERMVKRSCSESSSTSASSPTSAGFSICANSLIHSSSLYARQADEQHTTDNNVDKTDDALNTMKNVYKCYGDLNVLFIDNPDVSTYLSECWAPEHLNHVQHITGPPVVYTTTPCRDLIKTINSTTGSSTSINTKIRQFIGAHYILDDLEHADYYFSEATFLDFVHMMNSPRNPLFFSMKERTAAPITTICILHNLFLSCNDFVSFNWIERNAEVTEEVKWDGICFSLKDKRFTPVLIEFSGGIKFNSTTTKEQGDEEKMIKSLTKLLDYSKWLLYTYVLTVSAITNTIFNKHVLPRGHVFD